MVEIGNMLVTFLFVRINLFKSLVTFLVIHDAIVEMEKLKRNSDWEVFTRKY